MPKNDDPIVYRYTGHDGESLTGIPGHSLRQSDVDAMDADQKALIKAHLKGEGHRHIYSEVEAASAPDMTADDPARSSKAAKAGSEK